MGTPYLSEIRIVSFAYAPKGWAFCNGQTLPISQNTALFSLLGTTYGGDGINTFNLPNLQGSAPVHMGTDPHGNTYPIGMTGGQAYVQLTTPEMPAHSHQALGVSTVATSHSPAGETWADSPSGPYSLSPNAAMSVKSVESQGASQPHPNMPPYLTINFVIALVGIFPSQN